MKINFIKMHGLGNDYIYFDCFKQPLEDPALLAPLLSDRHRGIGGDGIILILPSLAADARMRMFNADGSEAEMCGNGIRCAAKYLYDSGLIKKTTAEIETGKGILQLELHPLNKKIMQVRVNMGNPVLNGPDIPVVINENPVFGSISVLGSAFDFTAVSMGNPHCVIFVDDVKKFPVEKFGPAIENHPLFPKRVNVEFVEIINKNEVLQRTWERGSGETMACGTGACAVCAAGVLRQKTASRIINHLTGGDLELEWSGSVFMTGPAETVFSGVIETGDFI